MSFTLVTGATGFLGWHVARVLCESGHCVHALCRPGRELKELDVRRVTGDIRDPESLNRALAGCELLFHVAADYRLWSRDPETMYQSNVDGTRNVLEAAERAGVKRIVYTSTVGCIGIPDDGIGDENTPVSARDMTGHYKRSKWLAEEIALKKARAGLPVIVVNPTAPVGDHDWKPTPTGKIVLDFLKGKLTANLDTGLNIVDAEDVAMGHLLAARHGRFGERYILGSENLSFQEILRKLAKLSNRTAPRFKIPYLLAYAVGVATTGLAYVTGKPPLAPLEGVKMARKKMFVSHAKATRELGFSPRPADAALAKAVQWFSENGYH